MPDIDIDWIDKEATELRLQLRRETAKKQLRFILFSVLGALISVCSFWLYSVFSGYTAVTVLLCALNVAYAYFNVSEYLRSRDFEGVRVFMIIIFLIAYFGVAFGLVALFGSAAFNLKVSYEFLIYTVFLMPAFVAVIVSFILAVIIIFILLMLLLMLLSGM